MAPSIPSKRITRLSLALALALPCAALAPAGMALAQTDIAMSGLKQDTKAPVEVTADTLQVDQAKSSAVFDGNVVVVQGTMKLTAAKVDVQYAQGDTSKIESLHATGGVTMVTATEAAESQEATYHPENGTVVMTGNVLLTQEGNSVAGQKLTVDLNAGTGRMDGRVKTVLVPTSNGASNGEAKPAGNGN